MRKSSIVTALALAGALTATPSLAADKGSPAIMPDLTPAASSTSCYAQALGGGSIVAAGGNVLPASLSAQSWSLAGGIGCDLKFEKLVIGAFGRIEFPVDTTGSLIEADKSWQVGARLGVMQYGYMPYVLAGYESSEFSVAAVNFDRDGWFVGAGLELMLTNHLSLTTEYQYSGLGSVAGADIDAHKLRIGLSYRFNSLFGD